MKKIGFIDYYIDEWHANNYPNWIRNSSRKDQFELGLAWQEMTPPGKRSLEEWCREFGMQPAASAAQVVEGSDCLVVLSPDNPERHEDLCDLPLRSGKPVYVDKTFAPDLATAKRLFAKAEEHKTPMFSSSALRYVESVEKAVQQLRGQRVNFVATRGPGDWSNYPIHQFEPMVMLLGTGAARVRSVGVDAARMLIIDYRDGRRGSLLQTADHPFEFTVQYDQKTLLLTDMGDFFPRFIEVMLAFFENPKPPVPKKETLEIMALIEAGGQALAERDKWVKVPR